MKKPEWVQRDTVLAIQERLLAEFGGLPGIRDEGLLDSALARPENLFAYEKPTLFELAASYAYGLAKNHPFLDGNKRIAFTTAIVFLELNGHAFAAPETEAVLQTVALVTGKLNESGYAKWLKNCSRKG